jgi:acyl carrier protein
MKDRVKKVICEVFNIDIELINNESSPDNIENWDSLKHMNLIVALEEEFEIEFNDEEIVDSMNYALIVNILESK